jgi:hypothetical protein
MDELRRLSEVERAFRLEMLQRTRNRLEVDCAFRNRIYDDFMRQRTEICERWDLVGRIIVQYNLPSGEIKLARMIARYC